jgi:hypothetical protein
LFALDGLIVLDGGRLEQWNGPVGVSLHISSGVVNFATEDNVYDIIVHAERGASDIFSTVDHVLFFLVFFISFSAVFLALMIDVVLVELVSDFLFVPARLADCRWGTPSVGAFPFARSAVGVSAHITYESFSSVTVTHDLALRFVCFTFH